MQLELIEEYALSSARRQQLRSLLWDAFDHAEEFRDRAYFKQIPQRRILAESDGELLGQLGIEHRMIGTPGGPAEIFGIIDLCVRSDHRGKGYAQEMLGRVESIARGSNIDFLVLFASNRALYEKSGFFSADNMLRWTRLHEHASLGIAEEVVDELMVKPLGEREWPKGSIDLMGYLF